MTVIRHVADFFGAERYSQHAICLTNDGLLIGIYTLADMLIFVSYFTISTTLILCRKWGLRPPPMAFQLFAAFIFCCGLTHLTKTLTLFTGVYRLDVLVVVMTATVSAVAAVYTVMGSFNATRNR